MGFRAQPKRYINAGLAVLAAGLVLSTTTYAASSSVVPCDQVGRDLKSLDVPVAALTADVVDHVPTDPAQIDEQSTVIDAVAPVLFLTPRVRSILRDVFGTASEEFTQETPEQPSSSPLAGTDETSDPVEPAEVGNEASRLPRFQQQMFRTDI